MKTDVLEDLSSNEIIKIGLKQTEIGALPEDWVVVELGNLIAKNPDYGINAPAVDFDFNLPTYLRITDISEDGRFISQNKMSVDNSLSKNYYLESGDLVIARTGASVGKSYLYDEKDGVLVFAGFLIRFKPNKEKLNSVFFKYSIQTKNYWNWVVANSMRSGQPGLNSNEFKKYSFGLPPTIHEQTAIATALSDADALIRSLEKLIEKKKKIKQGAMQELLRAKEGYW
ncbi:MAG: restriction endonuclease subunit S [Bacteroidetes bacterium]|nr:restriction endonuclease subunit S [Bacteroidota bacterium]